MTSCREKASECDTVWKVLQHSVIGLFWTPKGRTETPGEGPVLLASLVGKEKFYRLKTEEKTRGGTRGFWEEHVVPAEAEGGHRHHRTARSL